MNCELNLLKGVIIMYSDINISVFLIGIIAASSFQFFILVYHASTYKKQNFLSIWLLGTGLLILGFLSNFLYDIPFLTKYIRIIHNSLIILGHGLHYVSLKEYFKPRTKIKDYRLDIGILLLGLTILSAFSENTSIRMISNSLVLAFFSLFTLRLLYSYRKDDINKSLCVLIIPNWINATFWVARIFIVYFMLPRNPQLYNVIQVMSYLSSLMLCILGSLGLILIINQKLSFMLKKEKLKLISTLETIPDLLIVTRLSDGKIEFTNNKFIQSMKYSIEDMIEKNTLELGIWKDDIARQKYVDIVRNPDIVDNHEDYLYAKEGSGFLASISSSLLSMDGEEYIISVLRDISNIRETENKLMQSERRYKNLAEQLKNEKDVAEKNSLTDELTGLSNRRYLQDRLFFEYARMKRHNLDLSLIMIDVDFFKSYNDAYGHVMGDQTLVSVAEVLKTSIRSATDIASRYGGEEFIILLPETDRETAKILAERIRKNIENLAIEHISSDISDVLTVSAGVMTFDKDNCSCVNNLIEQVDQALYKAKENGRNIVVEG